MNRLSPALGSTVFRAALGSILVAHGAQKLFGWFGGAGVHETAKGFHAMGFRPARQHALLAGGAEVGAGAALALGLATPAAGAGAAITMGVASAVLAPKGFFAMKGGLEYPLVLGIAGAAFAATGAGPISLDSATKHVFDKPWMRAIALSAVPIVIAVQLGQRRRNLRRESVETATAAD